MKKTVKFIFLIFFGTFKIFPVSAENVDIGLRLRSDGANVPIAICDKCPSKLKIYKNGTIYSIELVNTADTFATKWRVSVDGVTEAVKKRMKGHFVKESATGGTWVATLTCVCDAPGSTPVRALDARAVPGDGGYLRVRDVINAKGLDISQVNPDWPEESALRRTMNGVADVAGLKALCNILGYDSYVSSTCLMYDGRCNFTSPGDNWLDHFVPD